MKQVEELEYQLSVSFAPEDLSQIVYWAHEEQQTPEQFVYNATIKQIIGRIEKDL